MSEDARKWLDAVLLLAALAVFSLALQLVGFQFTPVFSFFSIYLPLAVSLAVFAVKVFQRRRRGY
ncbi:MAG: hypothetical protein NZ570_06210 [Candidatus Caldarchaeum sp.]|nr:hypothetical protein [Candidatus Caldarchaeum sp.]MCS7137434.1 hypothetical protein [Candidatus Caldarchaeum sp.]MDW8360149.1 hypothetical protein [Candidatus Caldarchaeum sp.]